MLPRLVPLTALGAFLLTFNAAASPIWTNAEIEGFSVTTAAGTTLSFDKFDTSLGTLLQVKWIIADNYNVSVVYTNPQQGSLNVYDLKVIPKVSLGETFLPNRVIVASKTHTYIDLGNEDPPRAVTTEDPYEVNPVDSLTKTQIFSTNIGFYKTSSAPESFNMSVAGGATISSSKESGLNEATTGTFSGTVSLSYLYETVDVPEPAGFALCGFLLLAIGASSRLRRRNI